MPVTVTMPQLGETVTEGTILAWAKQPGDTIEEDEVLLEISTDKVDTEVPSPAAGVIQEILVPEGETVSVGTPLAVIGESVAASAEEAPAAPAMAAMGPTGTPVLEVPVPTTETTPPAVVFSSTEEAPEEVAASVESTPEPFVEPDAPVVAAAAPASEPGSGPTGDLGPSLSSPRRGILSPVVRKLAAEQDIDLSRVTGSGEGGRITRKDVEAIIAAGGTAASAAPLVTEEVPGAPPSDGAADEPPATTKVTLEAPPQAAEPEVSIPEPTPAPVAEAPAVVPEAPAPAPDAVVPASRLRQRIAENMVLAKRTAAHVWTSVEVDFERVEQVRRRHKEAFKAHEGFSLTYLPFISRATMDALAAFPVVNSSFDIDESAYTFHTAVNLGIAVDMNQEGLVVMAVRNADGFTLKGLAREIRAKALKARSGKLDPDDVMGSTFTVTNPGPYGSFMSAPVINVPNVAILSTDTVVKRPSVITLPDGSDTIAIRHIGYLGLTWDHRAFDGSTAVLFLRRIQQNLETWDWEQELA
jgi:2-oxoglutarate dehydrogenase E2 component (dihydrolipoamide succinyltransferase)